MCYSVVNRVPSVHSHGPPQKKGVSPGQCLSKIKHVKGVFCVNPCLSVPFASNVPNEVIGQSVGGKTSTVLAYLARNGCESSVGLGSEGRLLPSLQTETPADEVSFGSKWLRKSHQKP